MDLRAIIEPVQEKLGLKKDGIAGIQTWTAIAKALGVELPPDELPMELVQTIPAVAGQAPAVKVWRSKWTRAAWSSGMAVDGDGSPRCYHPISSKGLDHLANAGSPGNWWGIACDAQGNPWIQRETDPAPGYYVSTTAMIADVTKSKRDPRRYVDSETVPYIVLPSGLGVRLGIQLGAKCRVTYKGKTVEAIYADIGPRGKIGEGSIALAKALGIPHDCRRGGVSEGVQYQVL